MAEGSYPLVGVYFYGTETAAQLTTRIHPQFGPQPLGGTAGTAGRVKSSEAGTINVRRAPDLQPVGDPVLGGAAPTPR